MKRKKIIALLITLSLVFSCVGLSAAAEGDSTEPQSEVTTEAATEATTAATTEATATTAADGADEAETTATKKKTTKKKSTTTAPTADPGEISMYLNSESGVAKDPLTGDTFEADEVQTLVNATQGQVAEEAIAAAGVSADTSMVYDIEIINEDGIELVALDGHSVAILLPFPASYDKGSLAVYYIDEDGQANRTDIEIASNGIEFSVDNFGLYVLTWQDSSEPSEQASTDMIPLVVGLLGILASVSAVVCLLLIRRRNLADAETDDEEDNEAEENTDTKLSESNENSEA